MSSGHALEWRQTSRRDWLEWKQATGFVCTQMSFDPDGSPATGVADGYRLLPA
ncbi:MAG: hypothetical protein M3O70_08020 [Actinomycetota bacterium]|nr:hypothetical protein [Actinomycetota bacterium]